MMKKILLSVYFLFLCTVLYAQASLSVNGDFDNEAVVINNTAFTKKSTIEDYEKILGKAERIEKIAGKDKIFAYDKWGISLSLETNTNLIQEIYITYVYDGDKKVAKEKFTGTLALNGETITQETTSEQIGKMSGLTLVSVMKGLYMGKGKAISLIVYYPDTAMGQFGFSFTK